MTLPCIRDLLPIICSGRARRTGGPSSLTVGAKGDTVPPIRPSGPRPGSGGTLKSLPDSSKIIMQGGTSRSDQPASRIRVTQIGFRCVPAHHSLTVEIVRDASDSLLHHPSPALCPAVIEWEDGGTELFVEER